MAKIGNIVPEHFFNVKSANPHHGKFNADIIHDDEKGGYRAILSFEMWPDLEIEECADWAELCGIVRELTGIELPKRKYMKFYKLSDWESIAGIDASHHRESCIVTMKARRNCWCRCMV